MSFSFLFPQFPRQPNRTGKRKNNDYLASLVFGIGRRTFKSSFQGFDWFMSAKVGMKQIRVEENTEMSEIRVNYCLSKLSIFLDLCSILVMMASALSASTNSTVPAIFSSNFFDFLARECWEKYYLAGVKQNFLNEVVKWDVYIFIFFTILKLKSNSIYILSKSNITILYTYIKLYTV